MEAGASLGEKMANIDNMFCNESNQIKYVIFINNNNNKMEIYYL